MARVGGGSEFTWRLALYQRPQSEAPPPPPLFAERPHVVSVSFLS